MKGMSRVQKDREGKRVGLIDVGGMWWGYGKEWGGMGRGMEG